MRTPHTGLTIVLFVFCIFGNAYVQASSCIPVYFEDSHAGSFYWIIKNIDCSGQYQLILFDKHSDASEAFHSDEIRSFILANQADGAIDTLSKDWRKNGLIQCFSWIEPLMPRPIAKVHWVAGNSLTDTDLREKSLQVQKDINRYESAIARNCGDLSPDFVVTDLCRIKNSPEISLPVIVSIDLDYFTDLDNYQLAAQTEAVAEYVLRLKNLLAVTIAISRPYLKSKEQADSLLYYFLKTFSNVVNMRIEYEPFVDTGPDRSNLAVSYYKNKSAIPSYQISEASDTLKSFILRAYNRINVVFRREDWGKLLNQWQKTIQCKPEIVIYVNGQKVPTRQFNYINRDDNLLLKAANPYNTPNLHISWKALLPAEKSMNITKRNYGYADDTLKAIRFDEKTVIGNSMELKGESLAAAFDSKTGLGTARIFMEVSDGPNTYQSNILCISRFKGQGYLGKLTEVFNLPYVLGSSLIKDGGNIGADAKYGADCSNFIIYGQRRLGKKIPYLNPYQLRPYLIELDDVSHFMNGIAYGRKGKVSINDELIENGLLLHFGSHIVAVYRDNEPKNALDYNDLIIHQLEDYPEIIPLKDLRQIDSSFQVMKFK